MSIETNFLVRTKTMISNEMICILVFGYNLHECYHYTLRLPENGDSEAGVSYRGDARSGNKH